MSVPPSAPAASRPSARRGVRARATAATLPPWVTGGAFTRSEIRNLRYLAAGSGVAVIVYGFVYGATYPTGVDPWWQRVALAAACVAFAVYPWHPSGRGFRAALYGLLALITAWVVNLLRLNDFAGEYDIGLLMIVSLIGGVIRSPRALAIYGLGTVSAVLGVASIVDAPLLHPLLFASKLVTVLSVFLFIVIGRSRAAHELATSESRYRLLFDASPRPLWVRDEVTGATLAVNDAALRQYGYSREEFVAVGPQALEVDAIDSDAAPAASADGPGAAPGTANTADVPARVVSADDPEIEVRRHRTRDGEILDVELASHPIMWDGRTARLVLATDVTAQRRLEAQLTHQAYHDPLTQLGNRALFRARVEAALARARRDGRGRRGADVGFVAVLFLDLDDFKTINDSLGHGAGDALLTTVAHRLLNATRGCDTVARLGGDEFAVLLDNVRAPHETLTVASRILEALDLPISLEGTEARAHASIGIATSAHAGTAEALLRDADMAMYRAKARGKRQACVFEPSMHAAALTRLQLEAELRRAVERQAQAEAPAGPGGDGFGLVFQPIVTLETGAVRALEALVRWRHPERGNVSPADFIPLAEETGLIVPLGRWVLREACRQVAIWRAAVPGAERLRVSVNVAERQLRDPALVDDVRTALADAGLPGAALLVEITESALMQDPDGARRALDALRDLGVRIGIDDFGTGYSSLSYLQQFPVDVLKIDRAFVMAMPRGDESAAPTPSALVPDIVPELGPVRAAVGRPTPARPARAVGADVRPGGAPGATLVRAIVHLGDMLGLDVVAEGVEDARQAAALQAFGCAYGQGYHFARPLEPGAVPDAIAALEGRAAQAA